ncbi:MAG: dockerin type I domain-containing protein [Methanomassiliicoccaceae archaeon]|nr:dockerin type I domain-containing protein [Methanomassiliicoccaceae archaeon]
MDKIKIYAVVAVVAVVAAGAGAFFLINSSGGKWKSDDNSGRLAVYGNANNDDYIDERDIDMIRSIIAGEAEPTQYADANCDGAINEKDIEFVRRMIDHQQDRIFIPVPYDGGTTVSEINYPLRNVCIAGYETITVTKSIGMVNEIVCLSGVSGASFDRILYSDVYDLPIVGGTVWTVSPDEISKYNVNAIVTMDSASYLPNHDIFEKAGIDVVRITAANGIKSLSGIVTLGYLFGAEERANKLMEFFEDILTEVGDKVGGLSYDERVTSLFVTMSNYIEGPSSEYYELTVIAGSRNLADWAPARQQFFIGDEWLFEEKYQADFIVHSRSLGLGPVDPKEMWDPFVVYFTEMKAYKEGGYFMLNFSLPPVLRIAVMAGMFYPDLFGEGWAFEKVDYYFSNFHDNLGDSGYRANVDSTWILTRDMV